MEYARLADGADGGGDGEAVELFSVGAVGSDDGVPLSSGEASMEEVEVYESERHEEPPRLSFGRMFALNSFWLSWNIIWFILFVVTIPSQVKSMVGDDDKGRGLSILFGISGTFNVFLAIAMGVISDRVHTRFGRRRFWVAIGSAGMVLTLIGMGLITNFAWYAVVYGLTVVFSVVNGSPYNALLAEVVASSQRSTASAFYGAFTQLGYLLGAALGLGYVAMGPPALYAVLAALLVMGTLPTLLFVRETPGKHHDHGPLFRVPPPPLKSARLFARWTWDELVMPWIEPLVKHHDFRWVFITRFLMQMGQYTVQEFLQYWLGACVSLPIWGDDGETVPAETMVSLVLLPMIVAAAIGAASIGPITERFPRSRGSRKLPLTSAALIMTSCCVGFIFVTDWTAAIGIATVFGLGFGAFLAVDWALVMDVLPSAHTAARDVAIWHTALVLPQVAATPVAGLIIDFVGSRRGEGACLSYQLVWTLAASYLFLAGILVWRLRAVK